MANNKKTIRTMIYTAAKIKLNNLQTRFFFSVTAIVQRVTIMFEWSLLESTSFKEMKCRNLFFTETLLPYINLSRARDSFTNTDLLSINLFVLTFVKGLDQFTQQERADYFKA